MKKLITLSLLAISFSNCKKNKAKEQNASKKEIVTTEKTSSLLNVGCYTYNANNNRIILEITSLEEDVKGKLTYVFDGKDSNSGTFNGKLSDDKLFGTYAFTSEDLESKREVAFLIKNGQLIEGYGELDENGTTFVNKNDISYTSTLSMTENDCDK